MLKTVFFNLFIFAIGVKIGPQFFAGLERDGWRMIAVGAIVAVLAPVLAYACGWYFEWPQGTVAGVLAGSNNSSATFGAATAAVQSDALQLAPGTSREVVLATLSAAFALCYTVSQVLFVVLMKLMPRLAGFDAAAEARAFEAAMRGGTGAPLPGTKEASEVADLGIAVRSYRVAADTISGRTVGEVRRRAPRVTIELVRRAKEDLGLNVFTAVLAINSGEAVHQVLTGGPFVSLLVSSTIVTSVPALVAWWVGRHLLKLNPALLMGAVAGARQNTSSMQAAEEMSESAVPGIGYPVRLAVATVALSVVAYFFALFV